MTTKTGRPFDSISARAASLRSPWRTTPACSSVKSRALRAAFDGGYQTETAEALPLIGISCEQARTFGTIHDFLLSCGWQYGDVKQISHENDAAAIRKAGGLVVHIEREDRPNFSADITTARIACQVGDFVLTGARDPGEYLPRMITKLSAL